LTLWLSDQIYAVVKDEKLANEAIQKANHPVQLIIKKNRLTHFTPESLTQFHRNIQNTDGFHSEQ